MRVDETPEAVLVKVIAQWEKIIEEYCSNLHKPDYYSLHHGLGIIEEEVHELRMEIYKRRADRDKDKIRRECIDVAAAALRFLTDMENMK